MKSYKYIKWLMTRKCFLDFLAAMNYKIDLKEWSECSAMYHQIVQEFNYLRRGVSAGKVGLREEEIGKIYIYDVGCGVRPTLGVLCALMLPRNTKDVLSVDPSLTVRPDYSKSPLDDMATCKKSLEWYADAVKSDPGGRAFASQQTAIIAANHAHVTYKALRAVADQYKRWTIITCPCCVNNRPPAGEYIIDPHIWSPKNTIYMERSWE